ncbi:uncharacterized protein [Haliotis asinina]|uniref:uncharacterized protein n=1 Tax=Haliotis asinina TaxID=109174 RepID=UPI003531AC0B
MCRYIFNYTALANSSRLRYRRVVEPSESVETQHHKILHFPWSQKEGSIYQGFITETSNLITKSPTVEHPDPIPATARGVELGIFNSQKSRPPPKGRANRVNQRRKEVVYTSRYYVRSACVVPA